MNLQLILNIASALVENLLCSGIIQGWPSLQYVLEKEEYFSDLCEENRIDLSSINRSITSNSIVTCSESEAKFNLVFTVAISFQMILQFPGGFLFDHYGTWVFRTVGSTLFTIGSVLLAVSSSSTALLLFPASIFISVAGTSFYISNFQLANLVPSSKGFIITLMNGLFDSAVVVFLLIKILYETGSDLNVLLWTMAVCSILPWFRTFFMMPRQVIIFPTSDYSLISEWSNRICFKQNYETFESEKYRENSLIGEDEENEHNILFHLCLKSVIYWTNMLHFTFGIFRVMFYLGTFIAWLESFENRNNISELVNVFQITLLCGCFVSPLNGLLIDGVSRFYKNKIQDKNVLSLLASFISMLVTSVLMISLSVTIILRHTYSSFFFFLLLRSFVAGGSSTFLSIHFPVKHFGKLYGLTNCAAGLFGLLQFALFSLASYLDPSFYCINIGMLVITILTLIHPIMIFREIFILKL